MLRAPLLLAIPILLTVQGCRDLSGVDTGEAELTEQQALDDAEAMIAQGRPGTAEGVEPADKDETAVPTDK